MSQQRLEGATTMKRRYGYGIVAGLIVIGLVAALGAQPPAGGQGRGGQGMGQGMRGQGMGPGGPGGGPMAALNLTAEQQQKLQALMQTERGAHQAAMKNVRELRNQLRQALYAGETPNQAALTLAKDIASIEAEARVRMQMAAADVLTPDQKKILLESGMEFPPARMGAGGRGGRGGQPPVKK
jgi:Spy/CpxP family protein refolding chaperone